MAEKRSVDPTSLSPTHLLECRINGALGASPSKSSSVISEGSSREPEQMQSVQKLEPSLSFENRVGDKSSTFEDGEL